MSNPKPSSPDQKRSRQEINDEIDGLFVKNAFGEISDDEFDKQTLKLNQELKKIKDN